MAEMFDMAAHRRLDELRREVDGRLKGGGGSSYDGGMEARVAKLESAMEYVQRDLSEIKTDIREIKKDARGDFRLLFGAVIATTLSLAGLMAKGFHWL